MEKCQPLNKKEIEWLEELESLLLNPPTDRLGLYTVGDCDLIVYDTSRDDEINKVLDSTNKDWCDCVDQNGASLGRVSAAMQIHSTAG